ncbi:MAG TPA: tetratricopeptide repeat protein [Ottowia sp.]|nr:tetratricopeptide repeat protein [Ottowia sp.]
MKRLPSTLALTLLLVAGPVLGQAIDLGPGVSGYTRFLVYPHLQKGFDALRDADRARAYDEFRQALRLAPDSAVIAGYLAEAYRQFGDTDKARQLLQQQIAKHPGDAALRRTLASLEPVAAPRTAEPQTQASAQATDPGPASGTVPSADQASAVAPTHENETPARRALAQQDAAPSRASAPQGVASRRTPSRGAISRSARLPRSASPGAALAAGPAAGRRGAAYDSADTAYKASAQGDFQSAARAARQAVQLEPDNGDYRRLLAYALLETGAYADVEAVAGQGTPSDPELTELARQARQRRAYAEFEAANRALAQGDVDRAIEQAARGAELAPGVLAHQVQWLGTLASASRWSALETAASRVLERPGMDSADIRVLRAHARQRQDRLDDAVADFDRALALASDDSTRGRNVRLIAADAALAAGQDNRAEQLLAALPGTADADAEVDTRRRQASAGKRRPMLPSPAIAPTLATPKVICIGSSHTPYCELWPGEVPDDPGAASADAAVRAYAAASYADAASQARAAVEHAPANRRYQLLYVRALLAAGQPAQALDRANELLARPDPEPEMLALRSQLHRQRQQPAAATADARAALSDSRLSVSSQIDLLLPSDPAGARAVFEAARRSPMIEELSDTDAAYLAVRVGDDASAAQAFARAAERQQLPDHALLDAGYVSGRLGRSDVAVNYFKQAIDAAEAGRLALTPQRLFETRREVADRTRTWGATLSLGYRGVSPGGQLAGAPATIGDSLQAGMEVYWRPAGYRDGSYVELYGGGFQTPWAKGGAPSGGQTAQGMLGARVKPFRSTNLVLAVERRVKIGSLSSNDWLLRAGYSYTHGTDLRIDTDSWFTTQVYAEAGRFLRAHRGYATFEADVGRSIRLKDIDARLVLFPHLVLAADHDSKLASGQRTASGAGVGLAARYWFNENRHQAPRSYVDVSLQYRARLGGGTRGKGVFLRITFNY